MEQQPNELGFFVDGAVIGTTPSTNLDLDLAEPHPENEPSHQESASPPTNELPQSGGDEHIPGAPLSDEGH